MVGKKLQWQRLCIRHVEVAALSTAVEEDEDGMRCRAVRLPCSGQEELELESLTLDGEELAAALAKRSGRSVLGKRVGDNEAEAEAEQRGIHGLDWRRRTPHRLITSEVELYSSSTPSTCTLVVT